MNDTPCIIATFNAYDLDEAKRYANALNTEVSISDLKQTLRGYVKYGHKFKTIEDALDSIYGSICDTFPEVWRLRMKTVTVKEMENGDIFDLIMDDVINNKSMFQIRDDNKVIAVLLPYDDVKELNKEGICK